jgi:hypothetical protein
MVLALCAVAGILALAPVQADAQAPAPLLPNGVAYDSDGNLYFADTNRNQVYESTLAGGLTIVAGSGVQGYSGDGGPATSAQLNEPQGVAIGPDGTLYIADTGNQRIRAVVAGQMTTLAGTGRAAFAGDGGPAATAAFNRPTALTMDASGALLVCDTGNQRVRRISAGVVATVAGDGAQGFAGDGGLATAAQLDTPSGVAVGADGSIYIADSHNQRIRVIATSGVITTFAGNGRRGYSGDGGASTAAELSLPRGVVVTSAGAVVFADSDNQRIREVSPQGAISTLAGSGVQGASTDGSASAAAALDTPRGLAASLFGAPVFTDVHKPSVREIAPNGNLYLPAGMVTPPRTSSVALVLPGSLSYGGNASVSVTGTAGTPQGLVQILNNGSIVAKGSLSAGSATLSMASLPVGSYNLHAAYLGDGINPAATGAAAGVSVAPAPLTVTANPQTVEYGQAIPTLTGSWSGLLAQDSGRLTAVFTTRAAALSPPGIYAISATLSGPASVDYSAVMATGSGSLQITPATVNVTEQPLAQSSFAGLPLLLSAAVDSTTQGTPTGTVTFLDGTTPVATAKLTGGVASATYLAPAGGSHSIVAVYAGDSDFNSGTSAAVTAVVGGIPDYTVAFAGSSTQTVVASLVATYQITVAAQPGPFTGAVSMGTTGLPAGATASFSPPQVVPGTSSVSVTLSVQTSAAMARMIPAQDPEATGGGWVAVWAFALPCLLLGKRTRWSTAKTAAGGALLIGLLLMAAGGCGARIVSSGSIASQSYDFTVSATSTNLAGAVVVHSIPATLVVQ